MSDIAKKLNKHFVERMTSAFSAMSLDDMKKLEWLKCSRDIGGGSGSSEMDGL